MKTKKFKTLTNEGIVANVYVTTIPGNLYDEAAVSITTRRLISTEDIDTFNKLNERFPIFFPARIFKDKILVTTMSVPIKISTFNTIQEFINQNI